jgi:hypothetical protein
VKVRMLVGISGTRGPGAEWPPPDGVLECDADEAAHLVRAGLAVAVEEEPEVETRPAPVVNVETRPGRPATRKPRMP